MRGQGGAPASLRIRLVCPAAWRDHGAAPTGASPVVVHMSRRRLCLAAAVALLAVFLTACAQGGGGGGLAEPEPTFTERRAPWGRAPSSSRVPAQATLPPEQGGGVRGLAEPEPTFTKRPQERLPPPPPPIEPAEFLSELDERGAITYRPPSPMRVGERYKVEARIAAGVGESDGVPSEEFTRDLPGQGPATVAPLLVGPRMLVDLKDPADAFHIDAITPAEQGVQERTVTTWEWSVAPRRKGQHVLKLTATAVIGENRTPYKIYDAPIVVHANPRYTFTSFWADNWQAVLTAIASLGALVLGVLTFVHNRRQQASRQRGRRKRSGNGGAAHRKARRPGSRTSRGGNTSAKGKRRGRMTSGEVAGPPR